MKNTANNNRIDYIEFGAVDTEVAKRFYNGVFGWSFTDYGPGYTSFDDGRITGGFSADKSPGSSPLVVIYAADLEEAYAKVKKHGGTIINETFSYPGGRRFHFTDPCGNELSVWSEELE